MINNYKLKFEKLVAFNTKYQVCEKSIKQNLNEINGKSGYLSIYSSKPPCRIKVQFLQFTIAVFVMLISSNSTLAQLPNLRTAADFTIFTTIGALDNTGTSDITGDIGANDGALSGFDAPSTVSGNVEWTNAASAQCAIDVQAAYDELIGRTPTVVAHAPAFGSGETLVAGVYNIGSAGSIAGNLTLDAQGDPDAIFIFQFDGAFSIGASSSVNLTNEASVCNVFWIAEGAISMGALTDNKGTFISNNGAISLGEGGTLEGRMLTTAGAASVNEVSITLPSCATILPIDLVSFIGHCDKQNIVLKWEIATETNNNYFTVERSEKGISWQTVGNVSSFGNSTSLRTYTLTDLAPNNGKSYYRLKQTDFNGKFKYSAIIYAQKCENRGDNRLTIYPNPTRGKFDLVFTGDTKNINSIDIFNAQGQNVNSSKEFQSSFDLSDNVAGLYFVRIQQNSEIVNLKFVLQK
jgi:hypothetical protein